MTHQSTATLALKVSHIHREQFRLTGLPHSPVNSTDGARGDVPLRQPLPIRAPAKLKALSLFAGIGGFDLGLERTGGFETVAFCEIDPFCQRVLAKHWPEVPCYDDVRELTGERLAADGIAIDVICGGFPCQDISPAGKQRGLVGERSGLWRFMARLIGDVRPSYIILENSYELLRIGASEVFGDLAALGFHIEWNCIPACALGAPHGRDRVWIVAHAAQKPGVHKPHIGEELWRWLSDDRDVWARCPWDEAASAVCRVDDGIPNRVDRTGALGNAVVPQIPELIGHAILSAKPHLAQHGSDQSSLCVDPLFHSSEVSGG